MQTLPAALLGLADYPQFILYRLSPSATKPGKMDKFPIDWRTGWKHDPTDPQAWTTADNALSQVTLGKADGIGFVFTERDPFWFLDIDSALDDTGQWSELSQWLCKAFPGAAVEVSSSGKGLHIFGTGTAPAHGCRNAALGLEFYTADRFVALTGLHASGDCRADMSHVLPWLVANYFPPGVKGAERPTEWTTEPRADWRGPTDDEDLLRRALQSKSAGSLFGNKASFADLWEANVTALAAAFPDQDKPYNESSADQALANHFAFWTGCNMERMLALMMRSGLKRDKYERGDYLEKFTIPSAVAICREVCQDKPVIAPQLDPTAMLAAYDAGLVPATAKPREGETYLQPPQQIEFFKGCVYVKAPNRVFTPSGAMLKPEQFKIIYGGHTFVMDNGNEKVSRDAWEAFTQSAVNTCVIADDSQFRPDLPPGAITTDEGQTFVNTYVPVPIDRTPGDVGRFLAHLRKLLPVERDQEILLAYMAACVQHIGIKLQWAPFIQGVEGNGKSLFSRCIEHAVGRRYTHWPRADQISAKFNGWLENNLFIAVEDIYLPDDRGEVIEIIKPMITNDRGPVEQKGVDQRTAYLCANFMINSNHKGALPKTRNDRRLAPFHTAQQQKEDLARDGFTPEYFPSIYRWLKREGGYSAVAHYLASYAIPAELNPAGECQIAPITSSTEEAISASIGSIEQEVVEAIQSGVPGFIGGWVSSHALTRLLEKLGRSRSLSHRKREQLLTDMGYVKHPGLPDGRVNNAVPPDASKPVLFVKAGSLLLNYTGPAEIARAYSTAQMPALEFGSRVA